MNNINELIDFLRQKTAEIEQRIVDLRQNNLADMSGMQKDVEALCKRISAADIKEPQDKKVLETGMVTMITRLDELEAELKLYRQRRMDERDAEWKS